MVGSTAKGFSEYVGLRLLFVDRVLMNSRDLFAQTGSIPAHGKFTADLGTVGPMLLQISVADQHGQVVASSLPLNPGVSIADRPHFLEFKKDTRDRLHVSQPVVGRVSKKMSLQLVRPILGAAGEFQGIIVASIDPIKLQQYFDSVDAFADDGTVVIVGRDDGVVRARFSQSEITWGQSLLGSRYWRNLSRDASGGYEVDSMIDGARRLVGFHAVSTYPLAVAVTVDTQYRNIGQIGLVAAVGLAFTLMVVQYVRTRVRHLRDRELLIEQLTRSQAREVEANRMKSRFVASISHELRTPLNAILGFSELLRDVPDHPENARYAGLIHSGGQHLHALVNTLLDLAKIEAGRMEVERAEVDLVDVARTLVEVHGGSASNKGLSIALESALPVGHTAVANTDRTKYVQVLNNVLNNAVKFTSRGGVRVNISADEGAFLVVVSDTGCGIRPDLMARIFDRFSSASTPGSSAEVGTGLGLSLSRELIRLLGGSIDVASQAGSGTQVSIRLPDASLVEAEE